MNVNSACKKWGCSRSTIYEYCKIIPLATKNQRGAWDIPDIPKPPVTSLRAVVYIKYIEIIKQGATPSLEPEAEAISIYTYLADAGYITRPDFKRKLLEALKEVIITKMGQDLFNKTETNSSRTTTTKLGGNAGIKAGPVDIGIFGERTVVEEK